MNAESAGYDGQTSSELVLKGPGGRSLCVCVCVCVLLQNSSVQP